MERIAVQPWESLVISSFSRDESAAKKTARNKIYEGTFPFPLKKIGSQKVVLLSDIYAALGVDTVGQPAPEEKPTPKRGVGRPRKLANTKVEVSHV